MTFREKVLFYLTVRARWARPALAADFRLRGLTFYAQAWQTVTLALVSSTRNANFRSFRSFSLSGSLFCLKRPSFGDVFVFLSLDCVLFNVFFCFLEAQGPKVDVRGGLGVLKPQIPLQRGIEIVKTRFSSS